METSLDRLWPWQLDFLVGNTYLEVKTPLQHILGTWFFMGKEFFVSPDCLIPRPDTEILVEKAIELTKDGEKVLYVKGTEYAKAQR